MPPALRAPGSQPTPEAARKGEPQSGRAAGQPQAEGAPRRAASHRGSGGPTSSPHQASRGQRKQARSPDRRRAPRPCRIPSGLMTNTGRDARTRRSALARRCVLGARGSPGRHRRDQRSPSSAPRALATSATRRPPPARVRGLRRSEAPGLVPVSLNGGVSGPPLQLLPGWPRAPLLRGEPRWRRLWLREEDGRGGGSGGGKRLPIAGSARLLGALGVSRVVEAAAAGAGAGGRGTFEAGERSGAPGCGGRARYKEGKHGGGGLRRRRRRGKRLRGHHGGGGSGAVTGALSSYRGGAGGCEALRAPRGAAGPGQ